MKLETGERFLRCHWWRPETETSTCSVSFTFWTNKSDYSVFCLKLFGRMEMGLLSLFHLLSETPLLQKKNAAKVFHPFYQRWMIMIMFTIEAETSVPAELPLWKSQFRLQDYPRVKSGKLLLHIGFTLLILFTDENVWTELWHVYTAVERCYYSANYIQSRFVTVELFFSCEISYLLTEKKHQEIDLD